MHGWSGWLRRWLPVVATVLALAAPAPARAATTIGSALAATPSVVVKCDPDASCRLLQTSLPDPGPLTAPAGGVVVRWRIRTAAGPSGAQPLRLVVLRPDAGSEYTVMPGAARGTTAISGGVQTFNARLPIAAGDAIALELTRDGAALGVPTSGAKAVKWLAPLPSTEETAAADEPFDDVELLFNADVEPDADGDGFGDETQDGCPQAASITAPCPADLSVTNVASPTSAVADQPVADAIDVRNLGPFAASGARLSLSLFGSFAAVSAPAPGPCGALPPAPFTRDCTLPDLPPGAGATVALTATVPTSVASMAGMAITITSTASVSQFGSSPAPGLPSAWQDGNPGNNAAQTVWTVPRPAPPVDRVPPTLTIAPRREALRTALARGLRVRVSGSEACRGTVKLQLGSRAARRLHLQRTVGRKSFTLPTAGTASLRVTFTARARARLRRSASVRLAVRLTASDFAGNAASAKTATSVLRRS